MAGFADVGGVTVRQIDQVIVQPHGLGRLQDLFVGRIGERLGDIFTQRARKQERLLRHITDPTRQFAPRELGHIGAVD